MHHEKSCKYIFVTGGVISGLGKGITTASIGLLLKSAGYKVSALKVDMYLNVDAGTMNPVEHGEVFVTEDGIETDQDIGNYERFLNRDLHRHNYLTLGQVYWDVLNKERSLGYKGKTVQGHIHIPQDIISKLKSVAKKDKADILLIEVGGTVGEYQNVMFFEAMRRFRQKYPENVFIAHLVYLPVPHHLGEMKSKPAQASIYELYKLGLCPDFVVCRSDKPLDKKRRETIAFNTGIDLEAIFTAPTIDNIYEIPVLLQKQGMDKKVFETIGLQKRAADLTHWNKYLKQAKKPSKKVSVAIVGKYFASGGYSLEDAYVCVIEALKHAAAKVGSKVQIDWFDVEKVRPEKLSKYDGVIIPQGWGSRGVEEKIQMVEYVRTNKIPFLGLCFGMQMAVIEYARNVLGLEGANTIEANPDTAHPVIHIMPDQEKYLKQKKYGGTIRLGAWPCKLRAGSLLKKLYGGRKAQVMERHRHRYEVNNKYKKRLEDAGLRITGTSPDGKLAEAVELSKNNHPFFVATQFHPEYKSRPLKPHPLFCGFIEACKTH
jgi:CTP synthase